jgi:hypothetical protein
MEPIRIPLREAGGCFASTARYSGDSAQRIGRHGSKAKDNAARKLRKRQRRNWKAIPSDS